MKVLIPTLFVFLWSTGFIGARFGLPYAEPMSFLALRMILNLGCLLLLVLIWRAPWPQRREIGHMLVVGVLLHGIYLGGVFIAIDFGTPTGVTALLVGLQPLLTTLIAVSFSGFRPPPRQLLGLLLGVIGIALVLWPKEGALQLPLAGVAAALAALLGITLGTLYQKRFCQQQHLLQSTFWQYLGALILFGPAALLWDERAVEWTLTFSLALAWSVVILSVVTILLLLLLIRQGEINRVTSLFFLVPPATALQGYLWFNESLSLQVIAGGTITLLAVFLISTAVRPSGASNRE
ncbi:DMT family transporter [Aestuariirhabdus litorea]|uniref:DMT family transporter n=1 Tax=Aestuariirhabdus litorea TaxID=2528527 RepID=A0A3P3VMQ3_9GAMM|nr:DMT family transporter [Aestuariirhabdus litorea]RRJ83617.1 DMT family transporter [Aestuariirhabdus litorea]RWW96838.1 DMT family transporter [Endozoicomonadaceae bacterium GTF-13]